jgi:hypothetical protein
VEAAEEDPAVPMVVVVVVVVDTVVRARKHAHGTAMQKWTIRDFVLSRMYRIVVRMILFTCGGGRGGGGGRGCQSKCATCV